MPGCLAVRNQTTRACSRARRAPSVSRSGSPGPRPTIVMVMPGFLEAACDSITAMTEADATEGPGQGWARGVRLLARALFYVALPLALLTTSISFAFNEERVYE